jgi:serine/threonine protein kinase
MESAVHEHVTRELNSGSRTIYRSQVMPVTNGPLVVSDFGAAFIGDPGQKFKGDVMPNLYRAPEIILGMTRDSKIDIWSVGLMVSR